MFKPCCFLIAGLCFLSELPIVGNAQHLAAQSAFDYQTVALTGETLPGDVDASYSSFGTVWINAQGQTAFSSIVAGNAGEVSIVSDVLGQPTVLARTGGTVPGVAGDVTFSNTASSPFEFQINNNGQFIIQADVAGDGVTASNDQILLSNVGGVVAPVFLEGRSASGSFSFSDTGDTRFNTRLTDDGLLVFNQFSGDDGEAAVSVLSPLDGVTTPILVRGDSVPGGEQQFTGSVFSSVQADGSILIQSDLSGNNDFVQSLEGRFVSGQGLFVDRGQGLETVVLPGASVPSGEPNLVLAGLSDPTISGDAVIFESQIFDNRITEFADQPFRLGIFESTDGQLQSVVRTGDVVTLEDETRVVEFASLIDAGADGQVIYLAGTRPENTDGGPIESRFVSVEDGVHRTIALGGSQVPGAEEGVLFGLDLDDPLRTVQTSDVFPNFSTEGRILSEQGVGGGGQLVFTASLIGNGVTESNDEGLFVEVNGQLQLVAREGDLFDVNDDPLVEDLRVLASLVDISRESAVDINVFSPFFGSSSGVFSVFNETGQLVTNFEFTDGTEGVFVFDASGPATIPEPFNGGVCLFVLMGLALNRRPSRLLQRKD